MSFQLPYDKAIPISLLAASLNNTSATYKYYWLLSIIQLMEEGKLEIEKKEIFAQMLANSWYTINYFNISFGKQDKLERAVKEVSINENISIDCNQLEVRRKLYASRNPATNQQLRYFDINVPHWFLSPWFPKKSKADIYELSNDTKRQAIYSLGNNHIKIHESWVGYLKANAKIIKDFCYWNLTLYLQHRNPNVPDIPNKLIKPAKRNSLIKQKRNFWNLVIRESNDFKCIYTENNIEIGQYDLDHFIPYSFVTHDLIWNLIPADVSFNIRKGNKLPEMERYFDGFYGLQKMAVEVVMDKYPRNPYLEDYLSIFWDMQNMNDFTQSFSKEKFREKIQPLITIANNNGFEFLQ